MRRNSSSYLHGKFRNTQKDCAKLPPLTDDGENASSGQSASPPSFLGFPGDHGARNLPPLLEILGDTWRRYLMELLPNYGSSRGLDVVNDYAPLDRLRGPARTSSKRRYTTSTGLGITPDGPRQESPVAQRPRQESPWLIRMTFSLSRGLHASYLVYPILRIHKHVHVLRRHLHEVVNLFQQSPGNPSI